MDKEKKDEVAHVVQYMVDFYWPDLTPGLGSCLQHTVVGHLELKRRGIETVIQAGSICWPIIKPEDDDGVCNTHFSMMWEPDHPNSVLSTQTGGMPEIHAWLGIVESQELIDFATYQLKDLAKTTAGLEWTGEDPPEYLWTEGSELPGGVRYTPVGDAVEYVHGIIPHMWGTRRRNDTEYRPEHT